MGLWPFAAMALHHDMTALHYGEPGCQVLRWVLYGCLKVLVVFSVFLKME